LLEPPPTETLQSTGTTQTTITEIKPAATIDSGFPAATQNSPPNQSLEVGSRLIEIFGRVVDRNAQPLEDVLVTEERYFFSTRSDSQGNYKILMDMPVNRYPTLHFLRSEFSARRFKLTKSQLQQKPLFELDVTLDDNPETVKLSGWVGNDIGVALEGARVDLSAVNPADGDNFYLTVFTDPKGNFAMEGVLAGKKYRLKVNLSPEYPVYQDHDFFVSLDPEQVIIELKSLKFVDISGMILNNESAPVPNFEVYASNITTGIHTKKVVSDSSGFFTLRDFPLGEVNFSTRGAEYYRISGLTLTDTEYHNLRLIVDRGDHHLTGWVSDENGIAVAKAMVTLDATTEDGPIEYFSYRSMSTDSTGKFNFGNVGSGAHRVSVYANGFYNQEFEHHFENQSDQISIRLTRHN
jgi:hypothetical protein